MWSRFLVHLHQLQCQWSRFPPRGVLDLDPSRPEIRLLKPWYRSHLAHSQIRPVCSQIAIRTIFSPLGPISRSVRKPSGPTMVLVGIPKAICFREGFGDFLDFLLNGVICVLGAKKRPKWWTHNTKPHLFAPQPAQ